MPFLLQLVSCLKAQPKEGCFSRRAAILLLSQHFASNSLVAQYKFKYLFNSKIQGGTNPPQIVSSWHMVCHLAQDLVIRVQIPVEEKRLIILVFSLRLKYVVFVQICNVWCVGLSLAIGASQLMALLRLLERQTKQCTFGDAHLAH